MSVFRGSAVALITPFRDGAIDYPALHSLVDRQIAGGTDAIVCCATTGECATMSAEEKLAVATDVIERVGGRIPVIVSTGGNNTSSVIAQSVAAEKAGANALLIVTPYYNKTTQDGLVAHYYAVADKVRIPIIVYNVPSRTGLNILPSTMQRLLQHENIVGTKEASGNIEQIVNLAALCPDCELYSGNDDHTLPLLSIGGLGVISTIANIVPREMHDLCATFFAGDLARAREIQFAMLPLWKAAFCEVNPIPVKAMAGLLGLCSGEMRLPLVPPSEANLRMIADTLQSYRLL